MEDLRDDVRFLSMVIMAIVKRLSENETMNVADMSDILDQIDRLDGVVDGGLEPNVLRAMLGAVKASAPSARESASEGLPEINVGRYRRR